MIYNLSTILRQTMIQTNKNKEREEIRQIPNSFLENKINPKSPYNLTIDIELANRKSMELYKKYSANANANQVSKFSILGPDKDPNKALVEHKPNKNVLTICGICVFGLGFLAYSYFKKR